MLTKTSESLRVVSSCLWCTKSSRWFWHTLMFENHWSMCLEKHQTPSCVTEVKSRQAHRAAGSPVADRVCFGECHLSFLWLLFSAYKAVNNDSLYLTRALMSWDTQAYVPKASITVKMPQDHKSHRQLSECQRHQQQNSLTGKSSTFSTALWRPEQLSGSVHISANPSAICLPLPASSCFCLQPPRTELRGKAEAGARVLPGLWLQMVVVYKGQASKMSSVAVSLGTTFSSALALV